MNKTKVALEKEKLQAEIDQIKRSPWKKISTYTNVLTIVVAAITVALIWNSKALEIYNANLTADIKQKEQQKDSLRTSKDALLDSIRKSNETIKMLNVAKKYYDSIFSVMNNSADGKKKLLANMAANIVSLRSENIHLSDTASFYKTIAVQLKFGINDNAQSASILSVLTGASNSTLDNSFLMPNSAPIDLKNVLVDSNGVMVPYIRGYYGNAGAMYNPSGAAGISGFQFTSQQVPDLLIGQGPAFPTLDSAISYFYLQQKHPSVVLDSIFRK